jgi:hypothetical protein
MMSLRKSSQYSNPVGYFILPLLYSSLVELLKLR